MRTAIRTRRVPLSAGGFTLVEVLFATLVLALTVAGVTQLIVSGQAQTYNALHEERALSLAEALMDEVLSLPYTDPGGDTTPGPDDGEDTRERLDAIDDYDGFFEPAGTLTDPSGELYPELHQVFERGVTAAYSVVDVPDFGGTRNVIDVTVTVSEPEGRSWTISRSIAEPVS